jgi:hypothetical protein
MIPDTTTQISKQGIPMNNAREARQMLRNHRYGTLCTLSKKFDGHPFGSITPYLVDHDGSLLILISSLAEHTKNILQDARVSLITHNQQAPEIQTQGRVTVMGQALIVNQRESAEKRYLRFFPEALAYLEMHDFSFYRITPVAIRYIGGFGKIHWVNMAEYVPREAEEYRQQEEKILGNLDTGILRPIPQQRHADIAPELQVIGLDCDGLDARCGEQILRLDFNRITSDPAQAINALYAETVKINQGHTP